MLSEPVAVTLLVIEALEELNVPYLIGGSLASAVHGVARATADADLVADLRLEHAEQLAQTLGDAFYVDAESIRDAICHRSSFNVIHLETMFKVDVFVRKQRPFDRAQFERCEAQVVATDPERTAYVASPEDTVLTKLEGIGHPTKRKIGRPSNARIPPMADAQIGHLCYNMGG